MDDNSIKRIVIVGGGSAGWMSAAAIVNALPHQVEITLIESEQIGTVGVGEATIPAIKLFNQRLGITEPEFIKSTKGTYKLGIQFTDWAKLGESYFHPFGNHGADFDVVPLHHYYLQSMKAGSTEPFDNYAMAWQMASRGKFQHPAKDPRLVQSTFDYAYHFDAGLYAKLLRSYAESRGVKRVEGRIVDVGLVADSGFIQKVKLENGSCYEADLFVDCSGFRGLLIEQAMKTGYINWSDWLPCDRAVAIPCEKVAEPIPYTRSKAQDAGWQWRIPLQHRTGNGYVYSSQHINDEDAAQSLLANLDGQAIADPNFLRFTTGRRARFWNKNCVAIGLSAGFLEPLESTSLHLIQTGITRFLALFPDKSFDPLVIDEYNLGTGMEYEVIRDFLILHYHQTSRHDAPLWQYCANMQIPDSLQYKINHFKHYGRIVSNGFELFQNPSWHAVMIGQGLIPDREDPLLHYRQQVEGEKHLHSLLRVMNETASAMPTHQQVLNKICSM